MHEVVALYIRRDFVAPFVKLVRPTHLTKKDIAKPVCPLLYFEEIFVLENLSRLSFTDCMYVTYEISAYPYQDRYIVVP